MDGDTLLKYTDMLKERGARACIVSAESVETAPWTLLKCQYGCEMYGKNLCCPPYTPDFKKTREIIDSYSGIILFEYCRKSEVTHLAVEIARQMFLDGYYKVLAFGSGWCNICPNCALSEGCRFPSKAAPSMEACGIDVFATARNNGFVIHTLKNKNEQNHNFGLILVE